MWTGQVLCRIIKEKGVVEPFREKNCVDGAVNLTLDRTGYTYQAGDKEGAAREEKYRKIALYPSYQLALRQAVWLYTEECLNVPSGINLFVVELGDYLKPGLVFSPKRYLSPGYRGKIPLYAVNLSQEPVRLEPGVPVCRVIPWPIRSTASLPGYKEIKGDHCSPYFEPGEEKLQPGPTTGKNYPDSFYLASREYLEYKLSFRIRRSARLLAELLREEEKRQENE